MKIKLRKIEMRDFIDTDFYKIVEEIEEIRECHNCLNKFKALKISDAKFCSMRCIKEKYGV